MRQIPQRSTRTYTLFPYPTLCRSLPAGRRRPLRPRRRGAMMDFAWTAEAEALRTEVRSFLAEHLPPELEERLYDTGHSHDADFVNALGERHCIAHDWPRGGFPRPGAEAVHILANELPRLEATSTATSPAPVVPHIMNTVGAA